MATCPKCLTDNPDDAVNCLGCGRPRFEPMNTSGPRQQFSSETGATWTGEPTLDLGPPATVVLSPLQPPPPMVEPIRPPLTPAPPRPHSDLPGSPSYKPESRTSPGKRFDDLVAMDPNTITVCATPAATSSLSSTNPPNPPPQPESPKLIVLRGQKIAQEYPIYPGRNIIGRFADKPVDIDLNAQEAEGQVWSSRQHAAITYDKGMVLIEDLNSLNGTWVNGTRLHPGQQRQLKPGEMIQIGTVQLKLMVS